ncbi:DUF4129 domain-containing protein [Sphingobacterium sp. SRCM116780]|uniref:DUF4129 domain-containing protein n=1 Tax=Sphingobacterium sp. SRCM116780 TaxID=2907623 RepID=UPI001F32523F|nr:DUF4129 domain-containing protein [Sphingobacterium sp. SRCM116780]UIR55851.1 DUF4129 domain-containing protein [Sphingobacterium sp. SRCM116780]
MMNRWFFVILLFFTTASYANSDSTRMAMPSIDTLKHDSINIWNKNLFQEIPKDNRPATITIKDYKSVLARYQSEEFIYSENIKDKIGFFDRLIVRFNHWLSGLIPNSSFNFNEEFFYFLGLIGLAVLIYIFYKLIYSGNSFFRKDNKEGEDEEGSDLVYVEKNLMNTDLKPYLVDSIKDRNYTLAIRYMQLLNIQKLAHAHVIKWKYSKTNNDFANEISDSILREEFIKCTQVFEYVWFGGFDLTAADFERYQQDFKNFQSKIS